MKKFKRIYIEITNICNLNCSFCPKTNRPKKFMSISEFKKITDEISPLTDNVCLHLMGEPLLHPNLKEVLEICNNKKLNVFLTTNGTLLKQNINILKNNNCKRISISLHSYEANNIDFSLEDYLKNSFDACHEIVSNDYTFIEFRLWNESNKINAKNNLNNKIINFANNYFNSNIILEENIKKYHITEKMYFSLDNAFIWPIETTKSQKNSQKFCYALRSHFGILCDGTVVACCLDNEGNLALGNIFEQNIENILSCERAKNIYRGFTNRNITEDFCKTCFYATKFK